MTDLFHDLLWLPITSRIKYKLLIVTFKALRTGSPGYLLDLLVKQTITRCTRSQSIDPPDRLVVPLYSGERSAGIHPAIQLQHLHCGIVYQQTSGAQDH